MARKIILALLLGLLTLPLGGCYTMGYYTGKAVGTVFPTPPAEGN